MRERREVQRRKLEFKTQWKPGNVDHEDFADACWTTEGELTTNSPLDSMSFLSQRQETYLIQGKIT